MTAAVRPQTIETGSRFPAWDKENSLCFEIAFRRLAAAGDFEPCWNRQTYTKSNYDWSCNEPAQGDGFCTFSASLLTNPSSGEARVTDVCTEHAHPQCDLSQALREDLRKELEAACDELEDEAKSEFVKLRRVKRGSTTSTDTEVAPHVAQQLVVWDLCLAAGKERAERFEQALLVEGRAVEGYPIGGIFSAEANPISDDPLDHPLAKVSPLTKPLSASSPTLPRSDAASTSPSSPSTTPKGVSSKSKKTLVSQLKGKNRRSTSVVEIDLTDLPVSPKKRKKVKASSSSTQDNSTRPERKKSGPSPVQSSPSSLSTSPKPRTTASSRSSRTREGAPTPTPPELAIKREVSPELGIGKGEVDHDADEAGVIPPLLRTPTAHKAQANPSSTLVGYLSTLDPFGGFDYSLFAPTLEHLGVKNGKALERWAKSDEKLKPPQHIQVGSRFPAWDTEESCFELAFRKEAARRDFAPSWDDTNYDPPTHTFWGCAHTTKGRCTCTVRVLLSKDVDKQSPFVSYAYFGHNHPSSGLSDDVRFACNEDMAGVRKELRTGAFREFARLKKLAQTVKREGGTRWASFQQQLIIWDVWVAIGFKRARQFEKKMLDDGLVVEGYPSHGVLDNSLSPDSDPLAHPLAAVSPLMKPVSDAVVTLGSQGAHEKGGEKRKSGKGGKGKTGAGNKANGGAASAKKGQQQMASPVTPKKPAPVKTVDKISHPLRIMAPPPLVFTTEPGLVETEHAGSSTVVSPSPSNRLSSGVSSSKRSSASIDSPATKKRKTKSSSSSVESKPEVKEEEDDLRVVSFKAHPSPAAPSTPRLVSDPAFLTYLASLDTSGAVDYSIFASDLAHLGIKNHKALERVAATAKNRKRLVKDLAKLRSTDKYALMMFEEDLKAKVAGGKDG